MSTDQKGFIVYKDIHAVVDELTDEQLAAAGIDGGLVRFSVGLENVDDIIADIEKGFAAIR